MRGDVEDAAYKSAAHRSHLRAVHPDIGGVVDAVKVQPDVAIRVCAGNVNNGPVPIRGVDQAFGDNLRAFVLAVERLGIHMIVDQRCEHGARDRGRVPAAGVKAR